MITLFGLIFAAIVASFIYKDANQRGMNALGWAMSVFLMMIIFLPVYLIIRDPKQEKK